jgi:uncharacterized membrane protein
VNSTRSSPTNKKNAGTQNNQGANQQQNSIVSQQWSGPLPPPAALEHFNQIIPNGAERIMRMVELEQEHRITHDRQIVAAMIRDTKRTHRIGGAISVVCVCAALASVYLGAHPSVSIALVGVPIVSVINAIIRSKSNK